MPSTSQSRQPQSTWMEVLRQKFIDGIQWLGLWAVACIVLMAKGIVQIWPMVGGTWLGLLIGYGCLFCGGAVLYFAYAFLDHIQSPPLKLTAQLFLCVVFAIGMCGIILIITL